MRAERAATVAPRLRFEARRAGQVVVPLLPCLPREMPELGRRRMEGAREGRRELLVSLL